MTVESSNAPYLRCPGEKIVDRWLTESYRHGEKVAGRNGVSVTQCLGDTHPPSRLFF
jgi:hypothetical protein